MANKKNFAKLHEKLQRWFERTEQSASEVQQTKQQLRNVFQQYSLGWTEDEYQLRANAKMENSSPQERKRKQSLQKKPIQKIHASSQSHRECPRHSSKCTDFCWYCKISICLICIKDSCKEHRVENQLECAKTFIKQIRQKFIKNIQQERQKCLKTRQLYEKKEIAMQQRVQSHFNHLLAVLKSKKLEISQYHKTYYKRQLKIKNNIAFQLNNFEKDLLDFCELQQKTMEDLIIFQRNFELDLKQFIQTQNRNRLAQPMKVQKWDETILSNVHKEVEKIDFQFQVVQRQQIQGQSIKRLKNSKSLNQKKTLWKKKGN